MAKTKNSSYQDVYRLFSYLSLSEDQIAIKEADGLVTVEINVPEEEAGIFIGRYASVLDSLQLILSILLNKDEIERKHVLLDVGGYRGRRESTLKEMADRIAEEVEATGHPRALPPLSSTERRQVHLLFQDHATLTTYSQGDGQDRRLYVAKKA